MSTPSLLRETSSICHHCMRPVAARLEAIAGTVRMRKTCAQHGELDVVVSTDPEYTKRAMRPSVTPFEWSGPMQAALGCPLDCGPCTAHVAAAGAVIIELTDGCNMPCATCIAGTELGLGTLSVTPEGVLWAVQQIVEYQGEVPILMLSGGEPTVHPLFLEIVRGLRDHSGVGQLVVISNGVRFAYEAGFAKELRAAHPDLEIYLQFDSLDSAVLTAFRGADFSGLRAKALAALAAAEIPTTLVCIASRRVNLHDLGAVIELGISTPNVRGVTFQPIRATGRHGVFDYRRDGTTLTDVRQAILSECPFVEDEGLAPHPAAPESICVAYFDRTSRGGLTRDINRELSEKTIVPLFAAPGAAADAFRVAVLCYYDRFNFDVEGLKRSVVHIATAEGRLIPLDAYYLFYEPSANQPTSAISLDLALSRSFADGPPAYVPSSGGGPLV